MGYAVRPGTSSLPTRYRNAAAGNGHLVSNPDPESLLLGLSRTGWGREYASGTGQNVAAIYRSRRVVLPGSGLNTDCKTRYIFHHIEAGAPGVSVTDNRKQKIELCRVNSNCNTDYYLKVESHSKELKERSMNEQFRSRFEVGLQQIADSLTKKGGVKQEDKVHQRIGRLKQKYPSIGRYFDIETQVSDEPEPKRKKKGTEPDKEKRRIVSSLKWAVKEGVDINARSGVYFLRTSLQCEKEENVWQFYNIIREIEASFRVLKTDLDLRPVYH